MRLVVSVCFLIMVALPFKSISNEVLNEESSFLSFETNINGDRIDLSWETVNQQNIEYFLIEKSRDGHSFEEAFKIQSSSRGFTYMNYFNTDFDVWEGKTYYKISQINKAGNKISSEIIAVVNKEMIDHHKVEITERTVLLEENESHEKVEIKESEIALQERERNEVKERGFTLDDFHTSDAKYHENVQVTEETKDLQERDRGDIKENEVDLEQYKKLVVLKNRVGEELYSKVEIIESQGVYSILDRSMAIPEGKYIVVGSEDDILLGRRIRVIN